MSELKTTDFKGLAGPEFELMRLQLGTALKLAIKQMDEARVDDADVTMKIKLRRHNDFVENGEIVTKLSMDYKITRQVSLKDYSDGTCTSLDGFELIFDAEGNPYLREIPKGQQTLDDYI